MRSPDGDDRDLILEEGAPVKSSVELGGCGDWDLIKSSEVGGSLEGGGACRRERRGWRVVNSDDRGRKEAAEILERNVGNFKEIFEQMATIEGG